MDQERAIGFEHQQSDGLGKPGRETARIEDLAAGDQQTHRRRTVLSVSDRMSARFLGSLSGKRLTADADSDASGHGFDEQGMTISTDVRRASTVWEFPT